ncbi:glutathione S-transferase family protein [Phenylobacterium sp.]|uniref:glutathione S-transferase family protein n=1 Tax=Phenylobacterium sp. TaxID=1871053 RepID=UPI002DEA65D2|nr:glutathione S-transferase family protein [Phenylobacterium sp.]
MLVLHGHPLSTFVMKVEMALYELGTPFEFEMLDLGDAGHRARFFALWPLGKMPVLQDTDRGETVPETSAIIEYLETWYPGRIALIPRDPDLAWRARLAQQIFDLHVQVPMQKIVADIMRPADGKDPIGVADARAALGRALDLVDRQMAERTWALGEVFSVADCAAAPALFYADKVQPFAASHPAAWAYFERLKARPSFARALTELEPYFHMFPG